MTRLRSPPPPEPLRAHRALAADVAGAEPLPEAGCADCAACAVGALSIYAPTLAHAPEKLRVLRQRKRRFGPHQVIARHSDPADFVYTLETGWAYRVVQFPDGRRQILSFLLPGDTIAAEAICAADYSAPYTVRALTHATACGFRPHQLRELVFACETQRDHFTRYLLEQRAYAERRITDFGRRRALGSLAHLLVELFTALRARGLAQDNAADFPPRQEDLADALGLTTAHVNRTLLTLRRRGLVSIQNGKLRVHDLAGLRKTAVDN